MKKKCLYMGLPILGVLFCLWYIKVATCDVVYTDYIRLVNSYLPEVWNPKNFFVPDILTRIPINYLGRIINVAWFDYSTSFDMALGALGLGLFGWGIGCYCMRHQVKWTWFLVLMVLVFGLNKWEMLTNGSGWAHFWAVGCFVYHFLVLDRVWYGEAKKHDRLKLVLLPFLITLGVAGPYCAIYSVVMMISYGFCMVTQARRSGKSDRRYLGYMVCVLVPLFLYLWSNSYAVEDHAGMENLPLIGTFMENSGYFLHFFLKSFAGDIIGGEQLGDWVAGGIISDGTVYLLGAGVFFAYLLAVWMNFRYHLYKRTIFPLMLLAMGGLNHILILVSRWSFMNENYGMSSRYALQFQFVTLGIVLTLGLLWSQIGKRLIGAVMALACLVILAGSLATTVREVKHAPNREAYGERIAEIALQYREVSDDMLRETFDYRKSREDSGARVRQALEILDEQDWNVFDRKK